MGKMDCGCTGCMYKGRAYLAVFSGFLLYLTLGTTYTFGNMTSYLTSFIRMHVNDTITYGRTMWVYATTSSMMGLVAGPFGGYFTKKAGARLTAFIGCALLSGGVIATYWTIRDGVGLVTLTYGVLPGAGVGLAYVVPLQVGMRWFPFAKGRVSGVMIAGHGLGGLLFNWVQTAYINPLDMAIDPSGYFKDCCVLERVPGVFLVLGFIYIGLQLPALIFLAEPPDDWDPSCMLEEPIPPSPVPPASGMEGGRTRRDTVSLLDNEQPPAINVVPPDGGSSSNGHSVTIPPRSTHLRVSVRRPSHSRLHLRSMSCCEDTKVVHLGPWEALKTKEFYLLWFSLFVTGVAIGMVTALYKNFGHTFIESDQFLAVLGSMAAVCNCVGRLIWGAAIDRSGFKPCCLVLLLALCSLFLSIPVTPLGGRYLFLFWTCMMYLVFSGIFTLVPAATATAFGERYVAGNYGLMLTNNIPAAIVQVYLVNLLCENLGWFDLYMVLAGLMLFGAVVMYFYPEKNLPLERKRMQLSLDEA